VDGREADFPARHPISLAGSQLIGGWQAQSVTKPDPLPASQTHLSLNRIAKHHLWDRHLLSQPRVGQFQIPDRFLNQRTHVLAQEHLGQRRIARRQGGGRRGAVLSRAGDRRKTGAGCDSEFSFTELVMPQEAGGPASLLAMLRSACATPAFKRSTHLNWSTISGVQSACGHFHGLCACIVLRSLGGQVPVAHPPSGEVFLYSTVV
jgi:hypothetical protein